MTQAEELVSVAVQMAHDIRSPLAALSALEPDLAGLPDDTRELLQGAIARLKDIASGLLDRARGARLAGQGQSSLSGRKSVQPLAPLLDALVREKRLQYRQQSGLEITLESTQPNLCAAIDSSEFQRAVSNLVDNAAEACDGNGLVFVGISESQGRIQIRIRDNGKGMAAEVVSRVCRNGYTYGKKDGNGVGLYHAKKTLESLGGTLGIESAWGLGTTVTLELKPERPGKSARSGLGSYQRL